MPQKRNDFIDIAKYMCMLSVILGHFMQCLKYGIIDAPLQWTDYLFRALCAYEIPLFIAISGYFAYSSLNKTPISKYIKSRFKYLFPPLIVWTLLKTGYHLLLSSDPVSLIAYFSLFFTTLTTGLWFIWAVLYSSIILALLKKFHIDNIYYLILMAIILKAIQFNGFCYSSFKDVFIFFALGYWIGKQSILKWALICKKLFLLFLIISIIGIMFWQPSYITYSLLSPSYWISFLYNIILSISCSIVLLMIIYYIYNLAREKKLTKLIANIGTETLGIYLIQDFFFCFYGYRFNGKFFPEINNIILIVISILFVFITFYIIKLIDKQKLLSFLMLGKKTY